MTQPAQTLYLDEAGCRQRAAELTARVMGEAEYAVITAPMHISYLTGLQFNPIGNSAYALAVLVVDEQARTTLFADNHLLRRQPDPFVHTLVPVRYYTSQDTFRDRRRAVIEAFAAWSEHQLRLARIAADLEHTPVSVLNAVEPERVVDAGPILREMRRRKYPDELRLINASARAIEAAMDWVNRSVQPGMSELDVYVGVERICQEVLGMPVVVYGDFVSGPRTWQNRSGPPTRRTIEAGDLLLVDFSVLCGGYRADLTNTLCVGAEPTAEQEALMALCLRAMEVGERMLVPGASGREIARAMNQVLTEVDPRYELPHHAGHGLGLEHPEAPVLGRSSDDRLVEGDVVTLEPGVYVPSVAGMRIEHNYRITADGYERISGHYIGLSPA